MNRKSCIYKDIENLRDCPVHDVQACLLNFLREWDVRVDVSLQKMDKLLAGLRVIFLGLPISYKTIRRTPRAITIKEVGKGLMWYKSIKINLDEINKMKSPLVFNECKFTGYFSYYIF